MPFGRAARPPRRRQGSDVHHVSGRSRRGGAARASARAVSVTLLAVATLAGVTTATAAASPPRVRGVDASGPRVTSVSLSVVNQGETTYLSVAGSRFASGASVRLGHGVKCQVQSVTPTKIALRLEVAPFASYGARSVTVTNPDGASGSLADAVHVDYAPILGRWAIGDGAVGFATMLVRPSFVAAPTIRISGTGVTVANEAVGASGSLSVAFTVARHAAATWRTMTITQGLSSWVVGHGVRVRPAPTVLSVTPLGQSTTDQGVKIKGANFEVCAKKEATVTVSGSGVTVDAVSGALGNLMYATLTVAPTAPFGRRNVTVTNCDSSGTATSDGVFSVLGTPHVSSVAPIALGVSRVEAIVGRNLTPSTALAVSGTGVALDHVEYVSPTRMRATITVALSAAVGPRDLTVTDKGGASSLATGVLTIDALPTLTALSQDGIGANTSVRFTVHGTGFARGAVVDLADTSTDGPYLSASATTMVSSSELQVTVDAFDDTPLGSAQLSVVNTDGGATPALSVHTNPGPGLALSPSTTKAAALLARVAVPPGAPSTEQYSLRLCPTRTMTGRCVTRTIGASGATIGGLVQGTTYWALLTAPRNGSYYLATTLVIGPRRATTQLRAPALRLVVSSTVRAGALRVTFTPSPNAPARLGDAVYAVTACRNEAMSTGCVTRGHFASGSSLAGLVAGHAYHVVVAAVASAGYLGARGTVSAAVRATVQLGVPTITAATLARGLLAVRFAASTGAPAAQAYRLTACQNAALTVGCVVRATYRSGQGVSVAGAGYYVRVTAIASAGFLAASSRVVRATG